MEMTSLWKPQNGFHRDLEISPRTRDSHIPTAHHFSDGREEEPQEHSEAGWVETLVSVAMPYGGRFSGVDRWPVLRCPLRKMQTDDDSTDFLTRRDKLLERPR